MLESFNLKLPSDFHEALSVIEDAITDENFNGARLAISQLECQHEGEPGIYYVKANLALEEGNLDRAMTLADRCIALCEQHGELFSPSHQQALCKRAEIFIRSGRILEAKAILRRLLPLDNKFAYCLMVEFMIDAKEYQETIDLCTAGISKMPTWGYLWQTQAQAQYLIEDLSGARTSIKALLKLKPNSIEGLDLAIHVNFRLSDSTITVSLADRLLALEPNHKTALSHKYFACIVLKRWEDAATILPRLKAVDERFAEMYQRTYDLSAAEREGESEFSHSNLFHSGVVLFTEGNVDRALDLLKIALTLKPKDLATSIWIGSCYNARSEFQQAVDIFESIEIEHENLNDDDLSLVYTGWGKALMRLERFDRAVPLFQKALNIDRNDPSTLVTLAICYGGCRQLELAAITSGRALELSPSDVEIAIVHCSFLVFTGQKELALKKARDCFLLAPLEPKSNYLMGNMFAANQDYVNAFGHIYLFLKECPSDELGLHCYLHITEAIERDLKIQRRKQ